MSTMTLNLPQNYVEVEKEEMEYLDGGAWSAGTFKQSFNNLKNKFIGSYGSRAFSAAGGSLIVISTTWSYWTATTVVGAKVAAIAGAMAGPIGAIAAGLSVAGLVYYMGSGVRFK